MSLTPEAQKIVDDVWESHWLPVLTKNPHTGEAYDFEPEEVFSLEAVKVELYDYYIMMSNISTLYDSLTHGRVSKPFTDPRVVEELAEERFRSYAIRDVEEALRAKAEDLEEDQAHADANGYKWAAEFVRDEFSEFFS